VADQLPLGTFVVVSGPPGSGKTTLARAIAPALGLPLIAKDTIKQALMTVLPVPDIETSRLIGTASVAALLAVAAETPGAVLESVWHRSRALAGLRRLPGKIVAAATPRSRGSDTRCAQVPGTPVTSTPNGRAESCGTMRLLCRWPQAGL
jgi:energy-coupling factor transporter ATP-binding protein EcfA2